MRFVVVAPWKVDSKGPFATALRFFAERIDREAVFRWVSPYQGLAGEAEATRFLVKECGKLREENHLLLFLDENGRARASEAFAARIESAFVGGHKGVAFVLGGAYGLPEELAEMARCAGSGLVALSPLTLPHELAAVVLVEQIYRALCILNNHPYHHGGASGLARTQGPGRVP